MTVLDEAPPFRVLVGNEVNESLWRAFVDSNPHGTIFHTPEMMRVFSEAKGHTPYVVAAADPDGHFKALLTPVRVGLPPFPFLSFGARLLHYGGPLYVDSPEGREAVGALLDWCGRRFKAKALLTEFRNLTDVSDLDPVFRDLGYCYEPHLNYWIELQDDLEKIQSRMTSPARRAIRKAQREGIIIETIDHPQALPQWYRILSATYRRKGVPLADRSLFEAVFRHLVPKGMARFFVARYPQGVAGVYLVLLYHQIIYFWYSGDTLCLRGLRPTDGFMDFLIRWGRENGYHHIDWGWAGRRDEPYGVRDFKAKFGGREITFGRWVLIHSPLMYRMGRYGYRVTTAFRRWLWAEASLVGKRRSPRSGHGGSDVSDPGP